MRLHARAVVIGGGIAGCSVAYHLTELGWSDVLLLEARELTSGSTWHAAGLCLQMNPSPTMTRFLRTSNELYEHLAAQGRPTRFRRVGSLRLVGTAIRLDEMWMRVGRAAGFGLPVEVLGPNEAARYWPLARIDDLLAVEWWPTDGYVDPAGASQALAGAAVDRGAEIVRGTAVNGLRQERGAWVVVTDRGEVRTEVVVNAAGQWAREIGEFALVSLPVLPMEHQYVVTGPIAEVAALGTELPVMREPDGRYYCRQEGQGLLVGGYEADAKPWGVNGIPSEFGAQLLAPDLDRIMDLLRAAARRIPAFGEAGIRRVINGPDGYTPDYSFLMGEIAGRRGLFVLAGFNSAGIAAGGGAGRYLAEWIVAGQPTIDVREFDVQRFLPFAADSAYMVATIREGYARHFALHFPEDEPAAARPLKTSPLYDRLASAGARYGARNGWERALWYSPPGTSDEEPPSLRRPSWFDIVAEECRAVRTQGGVIEQGFAKFEVSGPHAASFLDGLCANALPDPGQLVYTPVLTPAGGIQTEWIVARLAPDRFYVVTSGSSEVRDRDWLERWRRPGQQVDIALVTEAYVVLGIAGPVSRALLGRVTADPVGESDFPPRTVREIVVGLARVRALRVSLTGELGWELHVRPELVRAVFERLIEEGSDMGVRLFGYHALDSLRMEAGFPAWGLELTSETSPLEAGLERFVRVDKGPFVGRDTTVSNLEGGASRRLVRFHVSEAAAVPRGFEPIYQEDRLVGHLSSGGYGHVVGSAIGYAYLPMDLALDPRGLEVVIMGQRYPMTAVSMRWRPNGRKPLGGP